MAEERRPAGDAGLCDTVGERTPIAVVRVRLLPAHLASHEGRSRRYAVETAERYADGLALLKQLKVAHGDTTGTSAAELAAGGAAKPGRKKAPLLAAQWAARATGAVRQESEAQADLLRDVIGTYFNRVDINPAWLTWNDGTVHNIAHAIYEDRTFEQMPVLADALEEAGCDNADILKHCREPNVHVRGCWVIDLLLGKH